MISTFTHLSLFTGIGGIDLAAEWAGFKTVGQVEQNPYAMRVLRKRFGRSIPRWTDIRDLSADDFKRRTGIDSPTLISGGFPCQPFSYAGKRRGKEDDRYLWPDMFRIVRELRPAWVLGENVAGIVSMALETCCADLEGEGYAVRAFLVPACGVGAWHRRDRVFIVAHTNKPRSQGHRRLQKCSCEWTSWAGSRPLTGIWESEPNVGRVAHGVSHRVDRLRCLGNAVVPQQVYPILAGIAQIENSVQE